MFRFAASLFAAGALLASAAPASAVIVTFATFSALNTTTNFRLVNTGGRANRTTNATLYSTSTGTATTEGAALVRFSFLQPLIAPFVDNVNAEFTYNATIPVGDTVTNFAGSLFQPGITGTFSFLSTAPITVSGPGLITHTYAAGSNLLSGVFTNAGLFGAGSSAATSASTANGSVVTLTSDFLSFTNTVERDRGLTLTAISPSLATAPNGTLNSFRATAGGQFSSNPPPLINGAVPEPASWAVMMLGFGLVGSTLRRRQDARVSVA